jgi:glycerate 2-kinase
MLLTGYYNVRKENLMNKELRAVADNIIDAAIKAVLPDEAVKKTLKDRKFDGKVILVAVGKAAWQMAKAASDCLGDRINEGIVITKYGHVKEPIERIECFEAGHPVPDENSFKATQAVIEMVSGLNKNDTVLFLLSGGGSALFEKPKITGEELQDITNQLLACGADIVEINTIRKRLSEVKGGRFAKLCEPAHVLSIVLSDILGDPLDMIASGPACADTTTCEEAWHIVEKYNLNISEDIKKLMDIETPKKLDNVTTFINGSVRELCSAVSRECSKYGYEPVMLTDQLCCQAKEAGSFLASIAKTHCKSGKKLAYIAGGETIVNITGHGKGGRNQEIALSAAGGIKGMSNAAVFSIGSDGTDGPTDAAGGYSDGDTAGVLKNKGIDIFEVLKNNDAYNALKLTEGLIITGPTGTNVNDVSVLLISD